MHLCHLCDFTCLFNTDRVLTYFILYFSTEFSRKHTLNCHRMKNALFSVLMEIKEKTGKDGYLQLPVARPVPTADTLLFLIPIAHGL